MNIETKTKKKLMWVAGLIGVFVMLVASNAQAQVKVGANPTTIDARSVFELESDSQALYLPRLTTTQRDDVSTAWKEGMVLYNTTVGCIQIYDGSNWECVGSDLNGIYSGDGTIPTTGTDVTMGNADINFDANTLFIDGGANRVGVGTAAPSSAFEVRGAASTGHATAKITTVGSHGGLWLGNTVEEKQASIRFADKDELKWQLRASYHLPEEYMSIHNPKTGNVLVLDTMGRVGIGAEPKSSLPDYSLEVDGQIRINGGSPGVGKVLTSDANGLATWTTPSGQDGNGIYSGDGVAPTDVDVTVTDNIDFDGSTLYIDGTNDEIGIGTDAPAGKLHVRPTTGGWGLVLGRSDIDDTWRTALTASGDLTYWTNDGTTSTSRITFDSDGRLGIGDDSPDALLDVAGSFRLDGTFADASGDVGTVGQILSSTATGTNWIAAPNSGAVAYNITTSTTIGSDAHFVIIAGGAVTLPTGTAHTGRVLTFINTHATNAITFATAPTGSITQVNAGMSASAIYDGTTWYWYSIN